MSKSSDHFHKLPVSSRTRPYKIAINFGLTFMGMLQAAGCVCDNPDLLEVAFCRNNLMPHESLIHLLRIDGFVTTGQILQLLDELGLVPAGLEHVLAFKAIFPDVEKKAPLVALGSIGVIQGLTLAPVIAPFCTDRLMLSVQSIERGWCEPWQIAGICLEVA